MSRKVRVNFSLDNGHSLDNFPIDLYSGLTSGDTTNLIYSNIDSNDVPFDLEFQDSDLNVNDGSNDPHHPYCYLRISSDGCYDEVILLEVPRVDCEMCAIFVEVIPPTPTPIPTATPVPDPTATPVPDPTATTIPDPTATPVPDPTATPVPDPTATTIPDPTATPVPDPTATTVPDPTATPNPTATPVPDPTATPVPDPTATPVPDPTTTPNPTATISTYPINISLEGNYGVPTASSIKYTAAFNTTNSGTRTLSAGPDPSCTAGCLSSGTITNAQPGDTAFVVISKIEPDQIASDQVTLSLNITGSGSIVGANPIVISIGNSIINQGWSVTGIDETTSLSVVIFEG